MIKNEVHKYCDQVLSDKIPSGELTKLAVKRYLNDMKKQRDYFFDEQAAEKVITFFSFLRHYKGSKFAGQRFELSDWQKFVLWNLYGWKQRRKVTVIKGGKKETLNPRRFRQGYIEIARKNGKTTFAAGIGLYSLLKDDEHAAEVYSAATTRDQAKIVFEDAGHMVQSSAVLSKRIEVYKNSVFVKPGTHPLASGSFFKPVSSEAKNLDGLNPHLTIIDEYHAHQTNDVYNVFSSARGARHQPMIFVITTAGFSREAPCYRYRKTCIDILKGIKKDESQFAMIFTKDEADDWDNPKSWAKSNPNIGISIDSEDLAAACNEAKNNPDLLNNFLTKNLNIWTDSLKAWIPDDLWMQCYEDYKESDLYGQVCYAGLDLGATSDFNALVLLFPDLPVKKMLCYFWLPEAATKKRDHVANYSEWVRQKHVRTTEGNVVDHQVIIRDIIELTQKFNIKGIAYDRALAYHGTIQELTKAEIRVLPFSQAIMTIAVPTKEVGREIFGATILHNGNPIMRWMNSNVVLFFDSSGNFKINKGKSTEKVDGMVALVMAYGLWMNETANPPSQPLIRML